MAFLDTRQLPAREPKPGWHGRFFDSEDMSFAYYSIDAGASLHEHSHPNEEVWNVLSGDVEITIGGDTFRAGAGSAALVPPNTAHSVRAIAASVVIVVDTPLRGQVGGSGRAAFAIQFEPFTQPAIVFEIVNQGRAAGVLRRIEIESGIAPSLPAARRTVIPEGELPIHESIEGGAVYHGAHEHPPITDVQRQQLRAGTAVFYLRGVILYEDATGERHHTTFCRVLDGDEFKLPTKPGYNYGD